MEKWGTSLVNKIIVISIFGHLALLMIVQFTAWPEMLAWPYLLTEGWLPYKDIAIAHTPLLITALSVAYKLFGTGVLQLQLFTWSVILVTTLLVWVIAKNLWSKRIATIAVLIFPLYQVFYDGNGLWFDIALAPLFLIIYYLIRQKKYIYSGIIFGLALLMKQTAIWFLIPIIIELYMNGSNKIMELEKRIVPFFYGAVLTIFSFILIMYMLGILPYFTHWALEFGVLTLPRLTGQIDLPSLQQFLTAVFPMLPLVFLIKDKKNIHLLLWTIFASLGVYPRWELFHFQPALPFVALGLSIVVNEVIRSKKKLTSLSLLCFALTFVVLFMKQQQGMLLKTRFYEDSVKRVESEVEKLSDEGEKIYIINYWDNIYALTDRKPAIQPLVPYLPWYLEYQNIHEFIGLELESSQPEVIVRGDYGEGLSAYKIEEVEDTIEKYYIERYSKDGVTIYELNK